MHDSCDAIWDLLSLYADGMAGMDDSAAVERHVSACDSCARDLAFMRGTSKLIATAPEVEPPSTLRESIIAATTARRTWLDALRAPAFRFTGVSLAGAAMAAVLVALLMPAPPRPVIRPTTQPSTNKQPDIIALHPGSSKPRAAVASKNTSQAITEHRDHPVIHRVEPAIAFQPVEKVEKPLFTTDSVTTRKPPAPNRNRSIAKLPKNDSKPASSSGAPADGMPPMESLTSPAPPMTMPDGMRVAKAPNIVDPGAPTIKPVPSSGKIMMTASNSMSASSAASLAGLRGSLLNQRHESERSISSAVYRPNETNQVTLDLIKSKF